MIFEWTNETEIANNVNHVFSGALAGNPFNVDRDFLATGMRADSFFSGGPLGEWGE